MIPNNLTPALSIVVIGAPVVGNSRAMIRNFLEWLQERDISPRFGDEQTPEAIVASSYREYEPAPHTFDSQFYCNLDVAWQQPEQTIVELWFKTWARGEQYSCRINISMLPSAHGNYATLDQSAEYARVWSVKLHQYLKAVLTIVDAASVRQLSPYNLTQLPLWVGWSSVYGEKIGTRYGLEAIPLNAANLAVARNTTTTELHAMMKFSAYMQGGWGEATQGLLQQIGGRVLHQSGELKRYS